MHKLSKLIIIALVIMCSGLNTNALSDTSIQTKHLRVGIFAALYLDSAFTGELYNYEKGFPKFSLQGLDFIQGAQIALDSLAILNIKINARIYDTKSDSLNLGTLINENTLDSLDLIIGSVKDQDFIQLAKFAKQKNIPFISATYPNDGGITANPFTAIVNPTIKAHCEAIYAYILQNHSTDKIYLLRKKGIQENTLAENFKNINEPDGKPLLKIEVININTNEDFLLWKTKLDSNRKTVIIGGSLNETFANDLSNFTQSISTTYPLKLIGMPNWVGFSSIVKNKKLKNFPIYYTSPYYNPKMDNYSKKIIDVYLKKYKGIPSDLTYKGFEVTLRFINLLSLYPDNLISHLNEYPNKIFSDYRFRPVFLNKNNGIPDYFENKNLYMLKILNGISTK